MKRIILVAFFLLSLVVSVQAAPILDAGWAVDQIDQSAKDSQFSPYIYNLVGPAVFSISDDYIVGDTYFVYDFEVLILTTSFYEGTGFTDLFWTNPAYSKGSVLLGAGDHSLTVQGDGLGGLPAGFWVRLDSAIAAPEPATLLMLVFGLLGLVGARRKFQK